MFEDEENHEKSLSLSCQTLCSEIHYCNIFKISEESENVNILFRASSCQVTTTDFI